MNDIMSEIHLELLDKPRLAVFIKLKVFKRLGYLAGGTALALQLNHRISEDFDIFIDKAVDNDLRIKVEKIFGQIAYYVNTSDQISFTTKEGIKITFVWYYFKPLKPLISISSIPFSSIEDIAADKAHTVGRRAIWRDYVDIFYLLKNNYIDIQTIIDLAKKKFKGEFVVTQFLEQLRYFEDVNIVPIDFTKKKYSPLEIKSFLEQSVETYLKTILPSSTTSSLTT